MGGRRSPHDKKSSVKQSGKKPVRGFSRGHGAHHRPVNGAPRKLATGKDRTLDPGGQRRRRFSHLDEDTLADLAGGEKRSEVERSIQTSEEAARFGAGIEGQRARGVVIEVRKGNFLTRPLNSTAHAPGEQPPRVLPSLLRCVLRGTMQQFDMGLSSMVAPGDDVEIVIPPESSDGELHSFETHGLLIHVFPRRSEFRRLHPSGRSIQTLAANVDQVAVIGSTAEPDFRPGFVDRVLVCAASSGLPAAVVLNKIDMGISASDRELLDVYRGLGHSVFLTSTRDTALGREGLEGLKLWLASKRTVLTGHSGVGKSSLMLALDPSLNAGDVRTGEVSTQTGKGTHTTTHAKLFEVALNPERGSASLNAEIIDTPGVREFTPAETDRRNLWGWFPELARLQGQCAFSDCSHRNEKGCAVLAAVERGEIHPRRHRSYVRIYETLPR